LRRSLIDDRSSTIATIDKGRVSTIGEADALGQAGVPEHAPGSGSIMPTGILYSRHHAEAVHFSLALAGAR
jgi:hypothetical protein